MRSNLDKTIEKIFRTKKGPKPTDREGHVRHKLRLEAVKAKDDSDEVRRTLTDRDTNEQEHYGRYYPR